MESTTSKVWHIFNGCFCYFWDILLPICGKAISISYFFCVLLLLRGGVTKTKPTSKILQKENAFFAALIIHDENALLLFLRKYFSPKERKNEKVEIDRISHILEKKSVSVA